MRADPVFDSMPREQKAAIGCCRHAAPWGKGPTTPRHRCAAQVLSTRARKDVKVSDIKVQVILFAFDCLYKDGEVLLQRPLTERRAALYSAVSEQPGELLFATAKVCAPLKSTQVVCSSLHAVLSFGCP